MATFAIAAARGTTVRTTSGEAVRVSTRVSGEARDYYYAGLRLGVAVFAPFPEGAVLYPSFRRACEARAALEAAGVKMTFHPVAVRATPAPPRQTLGVPNDTEHTPTGGTGYGG